ncbi:MAG: hypothetical protein QM504_06060 [Pseudomonadota bacterium]
MNHSDIKDNGTFVSVTLKSASANNVVDNGDLTADRDVAQDDIRIQITKYFVAIVFVVSALGMFFTDQPLNEAPVLIAMFCMLAVISYAGLFVLRNDSSGSLVFSLLCLYVWVAFPFKLMLAINAPEALWIAKLLMDPKVIRNEIAGSFVTVFPALFFLLLGLIAFHKNRHRKNKYIITKINHKIFISVIVSILCLRVFNQIVLGIGLPSVTPPTLSIPYLSGVLDMLSRPVLLAMVNIYFYYVIRLNDRKKILLSFVFLLINVALGLRVGWKSELVLQGLLLIYYSFDVFPYLSKTSRKFMIVGTASVIVITVMLYPLINHYRNNLLHGKDFSQAVESAQKKSEVQSESISLSFLNRINGISEYYIAIKLGEGKEFGYDALLDGSVMDLIKEKLYGADKDKAVTAFGTTYFSVVYLIGGGIFLIVFGFIVGWVIRWGLMLLRYNVFKSEFTLQAYLPFFCILWVKLLSSGGLVLLPMKELFLVTICLVFVERYGTTGKL